MTAKICSRSETAKRFAKVFSRELMASPLFCQTARMDHKDTRTVVAAAVDNVSRQGPT